MSKMGHVRKHLPDFRALDASLTDQDIARILEHATRIGIASPGQHGSTEYRAPIEIGGLIIPVLAVVSAGGVIKTGYPEVP